MFKPELIVRIESNENETDDSVIDTQDCAVQEILPGEFFQDDFSFAAQISHLFAYFSLKDLNNSLPLSADSVHGKLMVTLKRFTLC